MILQNVSQRCGLIFRSVFQCDQMPQAGNFVKLSRREGIATYRLEGLGAGFEIPVLNSESEGDYATGTKGVSQGHYPWPPELTLYPQ